MLDSLEAVTGGWTFKTQIKEDEYYKTLAHLGLYFELAIFWPCDSLPNVGFFCGKNLWQEK